MRFCALTTDHQTSSARHVQHNICILYEQNRYSLHSGTFFALVRTQPMSLRSFMIFLNFPHQMLEQYCTLDHAYFFQILLNSVHTIVTSVLYSLRYFLYHLINNENLTNLCPWKQFIYGGTQEVSEEFNEQLKSGKTIAKLVLYQVPEVPEIVPPGPDEKDAEKEPDVLTAESDAIFGAVRVIYGCHPSDGDRELLTADSER